MGFRFRRSVKIFPGLRLNFSKGGVSASKSTARRRAEIPTEVRAMDERLSRLRARLKAGAPDMEAGEIMAIIEKVQAKRAELVASQPKAAATAKILAMLPRAAEPYEQEIREGLTDDPVKSSKARTILRELISGPIMMRAGADGSLRALYSLNPGALLLWAVPFLMDERSGS